MNLCFQGHSANISVSALSSDIHVRSGRLREAKSNNPQSHHPQELCDTIKSVRNPRDRLELTCEEELSRSKIHPRITQIWKNIQKRRASM